VTEDEILQEIQILLSQQKQLLRRYSTLDAAELLAFQRQNKRILELLESLRSEAGVENAR